MTIHFSTHGNSHGIQQVHTTDRVNLGCASGEDYEKALQVIWDRRHAANSMSSSPSAWLKVTCKPSEVTCPGCLEYLRAQDVIKEVKREQGCTCGGPGGNLPCPVHD